MADKLDLEGLTTREISALYEKTRQAALNQRGAEQAPNQAREDLGFGESHYRDDFGNIISGVRPPKKGIPTLR